MIRSYAIINTDEAFCRYHSYLFEMVAENFFIKVQSNCYDIRFISESFQNYPRGGEKMTMSIEEVVDNYADHIYRAAYAYLCDAHEAEDVVSDVLMKLSNISSVRALLQTVSLLWAMEKRSPNAYAERLQNAMSGLKKVMFLQRSLSQNSNQQSKKLLMPSIDVLSSPFCVQPTICSMKTAT